MTAKCAMSQQMSLPLSFLTLTLNKQIFLKTGYEFNGIESENHLKTKGMKVSKYRKKTASHLDQLKQQTQGQIQAYRSGGFLQLTLTPCQSTGLDWSKNGDQFHICDQKTIMISLSFRRSIWGGRYGPGMMQTEDYGESGKPELTTIFIKLLYLCMSILVSPLLGENFSNIHFIFLGCEV